ncbi:MAG: ankyrin repeat domain-containing protein, partial [Planctomycetes bacterium]|nr:ankyrin repeat domain-containing protein [Planctomycetota bacterium]
MEMNVWALKGESDVREMHLMYISPNDTRGKRVIYRSNHPLGIPVKSSMIRWLAPVVFGDRTRLSVVANIGVSEQRIEGKKKEITRDMPAIVSSKHKFKEWFQRGNVYVRFVDENGQRSNNLRVDASLLDFDKIPDCSPRWEMKKYIDPPVRAFPDSPPPNGYWAARLGRIRQIKDAIKTNSRATRQVFDTGATLLHLASEGGHCDVAVYLIEHGASVEAENVWGDTPLHKAARAGEQELVTVLLDNGARASPTADDGRRPIHNAAIEGYQNVVRLLLNKGADVNVTNIAGRTPLHCAAGADELSTARVLLENGANVNPKTIRGETPLLSGLRWSKKGKVTHLLLVKGAKLETDKAGMGPLHYASERAFLGIVELLLAKNADVNAQSKKGKTPLHRASVENGYIIVRTLLTAGADPNIPDQFGRTVKDKFSTYKNCPDDIWASDESLFSAAYGGNTDS